MSEVSTAYVAITLDGSGAGSAELQVRGSVSTIRITRSAGTPVVTIADVADTVLNAVSVASSTSYHPQVATTLADGTTATLVFAPYVLAGKTTITIASGAAASVVGVTFKTY